MICRVGPTASEDAWSLTHKAHTLPEGDFSTGFHTFGCIWNDSAIVTYLDHEDNVVLYVETAAESFWDKGGWANTTYDNPWRTRACVKQGVCV